MLLKQLALYARVFDAAHFFLPSIPMLHRGAWYMAGAAMPRGARLSLLRASLALTARFACPETRRATCYLSNEWPDLSSRCAVVRSPMLTHNLWRFPSRRTGTYHPVPIAKTHGFIRRFPQVASILGMPPTCPNSSAPGKSSSRGCTGAGTWTRTVRPFQADRSFCRIKIRRTLRRDALRGLLGYTGRRRLCPVIDCSTLMLRFMPHITAAPTRARHLPMTSEVYT